MAIVQPAALLLSLENRLLMRKKFELIGGCVLAFMLIYVSCRKIDKVNEPEKLQVDRNDKFFTAHASDDLFVQSLVSYMKRRNDKYHFTDTIIERVGYPRWDKSLIVHGSAQGRGASDSATITYIPFVRDSQNYVNASLLVRTSPTDTALQWLCDWQYANYGFDSTSSGGSAHEVFLIFATMDRNVFGRDKFWIKDSGLLNPSVSAAIAASGKSFDETKVIYTLTPVQTSGRGSLWAEVTICYEIGACIQSNTARSVTSSGCPSGSIWFSWTQCASFWSYIDEGGGSGGGTGGSGGNTGGTGGGGSGSSGGGNTPPPCGGTARAQRAEFVQGCGPGWWEPPPDEYPQQPNEDSLIAVHLKNLILIGQSQRNIDSLFNIAQQDGYERTFTYNLYGNEIRAEYPLIGGTHTSQPNLFNNSTAIFHVHNEDDPVGGSDKNQCFDGDDIYKLYKNVAIDEKPITASIIVTRDYYYAIVITDSQKFRNYIRTLCDITRIDSIERRLYNFHIDGMNSCTGNCTFQKQSEIGALSITGNNNSSVSGVKLFRSPRTNINFTLLTP